MDSPSKVRWFDHPLVGSTHIISDTRRRREATRHREVGPAAAGRVGEAAARVGVETAKGGDGTVEARDMARKRAREDGLVELAALVYTCDN